MIDLIFEIFDLHLSVIAENRNDDALRLEELYLDLKSSGRIKQPISLMIFFYTLAQSMDKKGDKLSLLKSKFLLPKSAPYPGLFNNKENRHTINFNPQFDSHLNQQQINLNRKHDSQNQLLRSYMDSFSAFTDQYVNTATANNYHLPFNLNPINTLNQFNPFNQINPYKNGALSSSSSTTSVNLLANQADKNTESVQLRQTSAGSHTSKLTQPRPYTIHIDNCKEESTFVSNADLFREILLAFQGYTGRILEQSPAIDNKYRINPKYKIDPQIKILVLRLSNIGWLFSKINRYCDQVAKNESVGHVCKSFVFALQDELNSYLKLVTIIEQQLHFSITNNLNSYLKSDMTSNSFLRLQMVTYDSFNCLKSLSSLIDHCRNKRGGELINAVYKYIQQGTKLLYSNTTKYFDY